MAKKSRVKFIRNLVVFIFSVNMKMKVRGAESEPNDFTKLEFTALSQVGC